MNKYIYQGPVVVFGKVVDDNWKGVTVASSEARARSNLAYQWKKQNNLIAGSAHAHLPGKLQEEFYGFISE